MYTFKTFIIFTGTYEHLSNQRGKFDSTNQKHYPDLVVTRHQYGISALVSQTSFGGETSGSVAKCPLFSRAVMRGCLTGKIWVSG